MLSDKLCQPINGIMKPNRATSPLRRVVDMSNERVKQLLDMVMALPKGNFIMKFEYDYDVIKEFIEKWREIIEKENENEQRASKGIT